MRRDRIRRATRSIVLGALLALALTATAAAGEAIAEREGGMACATCHTKPPKAKLNDHGLYYEAVGTLDGFDQLAASFGDCSHCHVRKPGSGRLTRAGKRFARFVGDMKELREWLQSMHPPFGRDVGARLPDESGRPPTAAIGISAP